MAALTVYFDDSGTHSQSPIAIAAGWIAPFQQWKKFTREWKRVRDEEQVSVFHMADVMFNKKEFANWDDTRKRAVITKLRRIIYDRVPQGFGIAIHKKDYDDVMVGEVRKKLGGKHYTWAVATVIGMIEKWREHKGIKEPMEYIFDRMSEGKGEIDKIFRDAEKRDDALHKYGIHKGCHSLETKPTSCHCRQQI